MSLLHFDKESILRYFLQKMEERVSPMRQTKILNHIKRERNGELRHRAYKDRGEGKTKQWEMTKRLFEFHYKRLGFGQRREAELHEPVENKVVNAVENPAPVQQSLF
jgi:DNA repair photolyase